MRQRLCPALAQSRLAPLRAAGLDDGLQAALRRRFVSGVDRSGGVAPA